MVLLNIYFFFTRGGVVRGGGSIPHHEMKLSIRRLLDTTFVHRGAPESHQSSLKHLLRITFFGRQNLSFHQMSGAAQLVLRPLVHLNRTLNQGPEAGGDGLGKTATGHGNRIMIPMKTMFTPPIMDLMTINFVNGWGEDGLTGRFALALDPGNPYALRSLESNDAGYVQMQSCILHFPQ